MYDDPGEVCTVCVVHQTLSKVRRIAVPGVVLAALVGFVASRWDGGWLLFLDWAPGPRSAPWRVPNLPIGPLLTLVRDLALIISAPLAGWVPTVAALVVMFAGAVRLAAFWRSSDGTSMSPAAACVAGVVAVANPFVAARAYSGQVGVLLGLGLLWWMLGALLRNVESTGRRAWLSPACWWVAAGAASLHLAVIGAVPVLAAAVVRARRLGRRCALRFVGQTFAAAAAGTSLWFFPVLWASDAALGEPGGPDALRIFASRGKSATLWFEALTGGGFWRPLPGGILGWFTAVMVVAWFGTVVAWRWGGGWSRDARLLLGACVVAAVACAYLDRGPTRGPWTWMVQHLAPAGLLREPGKWVMLALPLPAVGAAAAVQMLLKHRRSGVRAVATLSPVAFTAAALAAWAALTGYVAPATFPPAWDAAYEIVTGDRCMVAVLGDGAYADPGFTGSRVVANPAAGFFGSRAATSTDPKISGLAQRPPRNAAERWVASVNGRYLYGDRTVEVASVVGAAEAGIGWIFVNQTGDHPSLATDLESAGFVARLYQDGVGLWQVPGSCTGGAR